MSAMEDFVNEPTETDWARLAMAIDCEGSFNISKYNNKGDEPKYSVKIALYNTNESFIDWLVSNFSFHKIKVIRKDRPYYKPVYTAYLYSRKACEIIWGVKPYLLIKDELAEIVLELQDILNKRAWISDEIRFRKEELYQYAKELNRRGPE